MAATRAYQGAQLPEAEEHVAHGGHALNVCGRRLAPGLLEEVALPLQEVRLESRDVHTRIKSNFARAIVEAYFFVPTSLRHSLLAPRRRALAGMGGVSSRFSRAPNYVKDAKRSLIEQTPLPVQYQHYHKSSEESFSFFVAVCFTVNYIMVRAAAAVPIGCGAIRGAPAGARWAAAWRAQRERRFTCATRRRRAPGSWACRAAST